MDAIDTPVPSSLPSSVVDQEKLQQDGPSLSTSQEASPTPQPRRIAEHTYREPLHTPTNGDYRLSLDSINATRLIGTSAIQSSTELELHEGSPSFQATSPATGSATGTNREPALPSPTVQPKGPDDREDSNAHRASVSESISEAGAVVSEAEAGDMAACVSEVKVRTDSASNSVPIEDEAETDQMGELDERVNKPRATVSQSSQNRSVTTESKDKAHNRDKDAPKQEPKSSPMASPEPESQDPAQAAVQSHIATLRAQLAALDSEKSTLLPLPGFAEFNTSKTISQFQESNTSKSTSPSQVPKDTTLDMESSISYAESVVKSHISLLHRYNELKDVGSGLMGMIAEARGVRIGEIFSEFGVGKGD